MLSVVYVELPFQPFMLAAVMVNVIMLSVVILNVVMFSVIILNVVAPKKHVGISRFQVNPCHRFRG
jgi:hypothetical protein